MKKLKLGDYVRVMRSKCGYDGYGEVIGPAYGNYWLIKIKKEGFPSCITVKETDLKKMKKNSGGKKNE